MQPIDGNFLPRFFAGSSPEQLQYALQQHEIDPQYYELQCNCLLIDIGSERILIDSGGGPFFDKNLGNLLPNLRAAGYQPGDIDTIILTHGHRDHVCGGVGQDGEPLFRNARQLMVRGEWEYWVEEADVMSLGEPFADDIRFTRDCLLAMQSQVELIEAEHEVVTGVRTIATPGHTRNHISVEVKSRDETLICVADTMDLPIHIENTNWHPAWDELPETGMANRQHLLQRCVEQNALIHGFHFPFPGLGYIHETNVGFRFEPYRRK